MKEAKRLFEKYLFKNKRISIEKEIVYDPMSIDFDHMFPTPELVKRFFEFSGYGSDICVENLEELGANSPKMYKIYRCINGDVGDPNKKLIFIGKIGYDISELELLHKNNDLRKYSFDAKNNINMPIITLLEIIFLYKDLTGNDQRLAILNIARGDQITKIAYGDDDLLRDRCAQNLGKALSYFHQYFMNYVNINDASTWITMIHGDFHTDNIFYNDSTKRIYFIDNASMTNCFQKDCKLINDIVRIVDFPVSEENFDKYFAFMVTFVKNYIETYPEDKKQALIDYLLINEICGNIIGKYVMSIYRDDRNLKKYEEDFIYAKESYERNKKNLEYYLARRRFFKSKISEYTRMKDFQDFRIRRLEKKEEEKNINDVEKELLIKTKLELEDIENKLREYQSKLDKFNETFDENIDYLKKEIENSQKDLEIKKRLYDYAQSSIKEEIEIFNRKNQKILKLKDDLGCSK
jgi:hypothetical protein